MRVVTSTNATRSESEHATASVRPSGESARPWGFLPTSIGALATPVADDGAPAPERHEGLRAVGREHDVVGAAAVRQRDAPPLRARRGVVDDERVVEEHRGDEVAGRGEREPRHVRDRLAGGHHVDRPRGGRGERAGGDVEVVREDAIDAAARGPEARAVGRDGEPEEERARGVVGEVHAAHDLERGGVDDREHLAAQTAVAHHDEVGAGDRDEPHREAADPHVAADVQHALAAGEDGAAALGLARARGGAGLDAGVTAPRDGRGEVCFRRGAVGGRTAVEDDGAAVVLDGRRRGGRVARDERERERDGEHA